MPQSYENKYASMQDIVSPDVQMTTNEKGGSQSDVPVRFDLIDGKAMFEMAKVLDHGAKKYGENNWRLIDVDDHLNHLIMHAYAYLAGDRTDDHLSHTLCRAMFALGVALDDDGKDDDSIEEIERRAKALGWEIGNGAIMVGNTVCLSKNNPFAIESDYDTSN